MNKEEIKIITLGDIFKNIETEEKAFKFLNYIKELQQENEQLKKQKDDVVEYIKHAQNYGVMAQIKPHLKPYVNGDDLLRMLGEIDVKD